MPSRKKLPPIGKSKKDRFKGAETWTVVSVAPGADVGLVEKDRVRIEAKSGSKNATLFPDTTTGLYKAGYTEIALKVVKDDSVTGLWYQFDGLLNGQKTTLWLTEGGVGETEAEITNTDPTRKGGGGGLAGIRR